MANPDDSVFRSPAMMRGGATTLAALVVLAPVRVLVLVLSLLPVPFLLMVS